MKLIENLLNRLRGLNQSVTRFPLTTAFLLAAAIVNGIDISQEKDFVKVLVTLVVGAFLSAVSQVAYERFSRGASQRYWLMGLVVILTAGYYLLVRLAPRFGMEIGIRTSIALFALLIAFIWLPTIKNSITFNESFMGAFKTFFNTLLFSGILFGGISAIIAATDELLTPVHYTAYDHSANIVFMLFAPIYFLSLIPIFPRPEGAEPEEERAQMLAKVEKAAHCPRFLEILISYIIIPLVAVFTVILILYIVLNVRGDFWKDNLLEPMLVSYSIVVILVSILASYQENAFARFYRLVFPKILVPIVLFQVVSSILKTGDAGITHMRYFVILYGIFAISAGLLMSVLPVRKNGVIAALLIAFAIVSILPPVDAFTISRVSQTKILEEVLVRNDMLENGSVVPKESLTDADKERISKSVEYLAMMDYTDKVEWLPTEFTLYEDFNDTFGFNQYYRPNDKQENLYLSLKPGYAIDIAGYDSLIRTDLSIPGKENYVEIASLTKEGKHYTLKKNVTQDQGSLIMLDGAGQELIRFDAIEIVEAFSGYKSVDGLLTPEEAVLTRENEQVKMTLVFQNLNISRNGQMSNYYMDLYVLVKMKS